MAASKTDTNLAAILETAKARVTIQERRIPSPGPHELLIRNHAIAVNPVDYKIQDYDFFVTKYPNVLGSDVCGTVASVGESVTLFKPGDRVGGFSAVMYNNDIDHGAWQTYTLLREIATYRIPDSMSFEEGAVFPMAFATAACALFIDLSIPRPPAAVVDADNLGLLVWGGSSSVGSAAIQIAKNLGLKVFATASAANHKYVKSLGATEVIDYRDSDVVAKVLQAAKNHGVKITKVFDAVGFRDTLELSSGVLVGGGQLSTVLDWPDDLPKPANVETFNTFAFKLGQGDSELGAWFFNQWLQNSLQEGSVVPAPRVEIVDGGIGATQKVFDMLKAGVSAKKLVVKL